MRRFLFLSLFAVVLQLTLSCGGGEEKKPGPVVLRMNVDSIGKLLELNRQLAVDFEKETGVKVEFVVGPDSATERLAEYQRFLSAKSPDMDIYQVDVVWPGVLGEHFEDLSDVLDGKEFFQSVVDNNTVKGRFVAAPYYSDAPMLYYRKDLLEKYGFKAPPATWEELASMAAKIMEGERKAGNDAFQGFVFQGAAYEGLTCNALEWQASEGGGEIVSADGQVSLNTEGARRAFERARGWIGTIAPQGVLTYKEEESRTIFQQGNAAFMRNWPYAYSLAAAADSPIKDKFAVTVLPSGSKRSAATLGGWGIGVSKYSRHVKEAKQFVAYLSTQKAQADRARNGGYLANRTSVYTDKTIDESVPYFSNMKAVFESAVARPSRGTGRHYNEISAIYYMAVHAILNGDAPADKALAEAEEKIKARMAK
jgi:trehalose/maltose transport system substrate-binding protein